MICEQALVVAISGMLKIEFWRGVGAGITFTALICGAIFVYIAIRGEK